MIGRRVGNWLIEQELGQGGMGAVYRASHVSLPILAAIKVLTPGLESEASFRQRFHREAGLQAQLKHPNVARVLDYLEENGQWFLVVEYLAHGTLESVLQRGERVPRERALAWIRQALAGLGHAHERGIVHRDIKPANLLLGDNGEAVVADFGIARSGAAPGLTTTGVVVGTPHYMSPEQIQTPDKVDHRSDLYSLGVVLYELLAGRKPFDADSQFSVLNAQISDPPPPLRQLDPTIPPALEAVVLRALAKRPEHRFADSPAMARELERALEFPGTTRLPVTVVAAPGAPDATVLAPPNKPATAPTPAAGSSAADLAEERRKRFLRRILAAAALALLCAVGTAYVLAGKNEREEKKAEQVADTTEAPNGPSNEPVPPVRPSPSQRAPPAETAEKGAASTPPPPAQPPVQAAPAPPPPALPGAGLGPAPGLVPAQSPGAVPQLMPPGLGPLPERPQVAVVAAGEPLLAASLEQEIERRLGRSFDVVDEHGSPEVDALLAKQGEGVSHQELGTQLVKDGFHVLVLLRVEEGARRTKTVLGIEGNLRASRIRMNAYLLPRNRGVGRGWTELVEYTELSALAKAKSALVGPTADLISALKTDWTALRAATGGP